MAPLIIDQQHAENYSVYNGDSMDVMDQLPPASIGFSVFSPPFVDLFCYSSSERDLGNCANYDAFFVKFGEMAAKFARVMKPGRIVAVHCIDIPAMKERDGYIGLKDFHGDIIKAFQAAGFIYHSRTTIWKDPLIEATRTKAIGLMHKQLCKDSAISRCGLPDYMLAFRLPSVNDEPITHPEGLTEYYGSADPESKGGNRSHNIWRAYASPVWMDIRQTKVLSHRGARDEKDEKHLCPLQIDTIARVIALWSNPGDIVFTPFMGVGSEVYQAVAMGRKGIGCELKPSYYRQAVKNVATAGQKREQDDMPLFADIPSEDES
jgi:DNA modification methylase